MARCPTVARLEPADAVAMQGRDAFYQVGERVTPFAAHPLMVLSVRI